MVNDLYLERRGETDRTPTSQVGGSLVMMTPAIEPDYWSYRVRITDEQAVVGFPKFGVVGIGFAQEEDWNTNLPSTSESTDILAHIWHNRGESIPDNVHSMHDVLTAIQMIQRAVEEDGEK